MRVTTDPVVGTILGRWSAALVLGSVHLASRPTPPGTRRRLFAAVLIAAAPPATAVARVMRREDSCWSPPASAAGRALLAAYVGGGVLVEELLWRAPLLHLRPGFARSTGALVSMAVFGTAHLRRDGLHTAAIHLSTTAGWTLATLVDRRLRCALVAHWLYNLAALSVRVAEAAPPGVRAAPDGVR